MQTSRRIDEYDVGILCLCRRHGIEYDRCRVCTFAVTDNAHARTFSPNFQLLACRRSERVGCRNNDAFALFAEHMSKFADGGCLAYSVYARKKNYKRIGILFRFVVDVLD